LASLDPALLAATTTALDACVSPVVLVSEAFSSGRIERSEHAQARCLIDLLGDGTRWADVVAVYQSGRPFPFGDLDQAREACRELPGADQPLTDEEQATADWLVDLAEVIGFELTRDETACIIVGSRGAVDPGLTIDLNDPDLDALAPVLQAYDACVPIGGLLAGFDDGAIVYSLCLDRVLAGSVGWRELADLGARVEGLTGEEIAVEPAVVTIDAARARCLSAEPGQLLVDLGDVLRVEVLVHDGTRLWAGGIDEHGGTRPGNLLVIDGTTGEVVTVFATELFSVEIITSDQDHLWVANADGEVIQRVSLLTATLDMPVELAGRAVGDLQLTADALWATDNNAGALLRLDRVTGQILEEITIAPGDWYSSDLTTAAGWLWLTTREDPVVRQLNPSTGELVAEYQVDSQYTTHLIDQGDAVGIYGFSQLWRIEDGQAQAEQLIDDYGQEGLDPDAAVAVGGVVAFADENVSVLAVRDSASGFIEQLRLIPGFVDSDRDLIATDGVDIWLTTYDDLLVRFGG